GPASETHGARDVGALVDDTAVGGLAGGDATQPEIPVGRIHEHGIHRDRVGPGSGQRAEGVVLPAIVGVVEVHHHQTAISRPLGLLEPDWAGRHDGVHDGAGDRNGPRHAEPDPTVEVAGDGVVHHLVAIAAADGDAVLPGEVGPVVVDEVVEDVGAAPSGAVRLVGPRVGDAVLGVVVDDVVHRGGIDDVRELDARAAAVELVVLGDEAADLPARLLVRTHLEPGAGAGHDQVLNDV